jgi:outer membrane protein TolC
MTDSLALRLERTAEVCTTDVAIAQVDVESANATVAPIQEELDLAYIHLQSKAGQTLEIHARPIESIISRGFWLQTEHIRCMQWQKSIEPI